MQILGKPSAPVQEAPSSINDRWFVILYRRGPNWIAGKPLVEQALAGHLAYMEDLCARAAVESAGGFLDEESGGMLLMRAPDLVAAEAVIENDPAVRDGLMIGTARPFYPKFRNFQRGEDNQEKDRVRADNLDVVRHLFATVSGRADGSDANSRMAAYSALYDPTVAIHEAPSLPYGCDYQGVGAVADHANAYRSAWDGLQSTDERQLAPRLLADHERVVVLWHQKAQIAASGERLNMPVVSVYEMKDKRITDSRMYHFDAGATRAFLDRASIDRASTPKGPATP